MCGPRSLVCLQILHGGHSLHNRLDRVQGLRTGVPGTPRFPRRSMPPSGAIGLLSGLGWTLHLFHCPFSVHSEAKAERSFSPHSAAPAFLMPCPAPWPQAGAPGSSVSCRLEDGRADGTPCRERAETTRPVACPTMCARSVLMVLTASQKGGQGGLLSQRGRKSVLAACPWCLVGFGCRAV